MTTQLTTQEKRALTKSAILEKLDSNLSLAAVLKLSGFPSYSTVLNWAENDSSFNSALMVARTASGLRAADLASDLVAGIVKQMKADGAELDYKLINPALNHLRWQAERGAKSIYGAQVEIKHSGTVNVRTSFLIPRSKQSVEQGEVIDLDTSLEPAQLESGDVESWAG